MGLIISELSTSIEEAMQRFAAIDPDFDIEQQISVTLEGNDNVIPFPNLNRKN